MGLDLGRCEIEKWNKSSKHLSINFAEFNWITLWGSRLIPSGTDVPWIKHGLCEQILALAVMIIFLLVFGNVKHALLVLLCDCDYNWPRWKHTSCDTWLKRGEDRSNPLRFACYFWKDYLYLFLFWITFTVSVIFVITSKSVHANSIHLCCICAGRNQNEMPNVRMSMREHNGMLVCKHLRFLKGCNNSRAISFILPTYCSLWRLSG